MTFENVWDKIKGVRLTSVLGFYGNVVMATFLVALAAIIIYVAGMLMLQILTIVPWEVLLGFFFLVSGTVCSKLYGWGSQNKALF